MGASTGARISAMTGLTRPVLGVLVNAERPLSAQEIAGRIGLPFAGGSSPGRRVVAAIVALGARELLRLAESRGARRYGVTAGGRRAWIAMGPRGLARSR